MFTFTIIFCTIASFIAGFIDSIAGGGGLIILPAALLAGVPPHLALGTNKFAGTFGTLAAVWAFARSNLILWRMAGIGIVFSLIGAYAGSLLALEFSPEFMGKLMIFLLPLGMVATLMPKKEINRPAKLGGLRFWIFVPTLSFVVGGYDGFFGPGTGSIFILAFHFVLHIGLIQASATAKVFNLASNAGALVGFLLNDKVIFTLGIPMALANIAGSWLGSRLAIKSGPQVVRKVLAISLSLLLTTLIYKYFVAE